eukprot:jgi/Ulvmu1/9120/UM005_0215.1
MRSSALNLVFLALHPGLVALPTHVSACLTRQSGISHAYARLKSISRASWFSVVSVADSHFMPAQSFAACRLSCRRVPKTQLQPQALSKRRTTTAIPQEEISSDQKSARHGGTHGTDAFTFTDTDLLPGTPHGAASVDALGESTHGNMRLLKQLRSDGVVPLLGLQQLDDILHVPVVEVRRTVTEAVHEVGAYAQHPHDDPARSVFCNRTLNLRSIRAIGFDMDYTLVEYDVMAWEGKAYEYGLRALADMGVPVDGLTFDPAVAVRGLIVDVEKGNLLKVDRFGLVKRAMHGSKMLAPLDVQKEYGRELVQLSNTGRWSFLNTLFSVSEGCLFMQLVSRFDLGEIQAQTQIKTYVNLWKAVQTAMFHTHVESRLKQDIIEDPARYVNLDPELAATLLDMKESGKTLMLITNSDWMYTNGLMSFAYDRFLPEGMQWRDLFDCVHVNASKPAWWSDSGVMAEIVSPKGDMRPCRTVKKGGLYWGGSAKLVQDAFGLSGDAFLYVGDHLYTDAALAKLNFQWRTALIVRELEDEVAALAAGRPLRRQLKALLRKKELVGDLFNQLRLQHARHAFGREPAASHFASAEAVRTDLAQLLTVMGRLDEAITPLIRQDGARFSERWGYLSIAGVNDKSQIQRQIEKYADIYTSRVSNFLRYTPYCYFRSAGQSLIHFRSANQDQEQVEGLEDMPHT